MNSKHVNWAGNITYNAQDIQHTNHVDTLKKLISERDSLKALGSRHSFNKVADTDGTHILPMMPSAHSFQINPDEQTVTFTGNVIYGDLSVYLQNEGYALHNLASLPHISVVGACATGTHGAGENNGNLGTAVQALDLVTGSGELITLTHTDDDFFGAIVGLGALGIIVSMTLTIEPSYDMRQSIYLKMPFKEMIANFDAIQASAYSVSLFTDWRGDSISQVWLKQRLDDTPPADDFFGALPATQKMHPISDVSAEHCTEQFGIVGTWYDRLPHFKMNFMPSRGVELQSEYFVPRQYAADALQAIYAIQDYIAPHISTAEIRTIAADNQWLSPCYARDSLACHFTWNPDWQHVKAVLPKIENALRPFGVRAHWGKLFTMDASEIRAQYPRFDDFRDLVKRYDPQKKFKNAFLEQYIYA